MAISGFLQFLFLYLFLDAYISIYNISVIFSQTHPLMSHSGFEHVFCYGDVLLSFLWFHDDIMEIKSKSVESPYDPDQKPIDIPNKHDFIRTQFHRTTHCDFCSKKVSFK